MALARAWSRKLLSGLVLALSISQITMAAITNHDVQVGESGNTYSPANLSAIAPQDTITFHFNSPGPHSVTQATQAVPCTPVSGGIDSGLLPSGNTTTFQITVNDTNPIWLSCKVDDHCSHGMLFAVNTNAAGYALFQQNAQGSGSGSSASSAPSASSTTSRNGVLLTKHIADGVGLAALAAIVGAVVL